VCAGAGGRGFVSSKRLPHDRENEEIYMLKGARHQAAQEQHSSLATRISACKSADGSHETRATRLHGAAAARATDDRANDDDAALQPPPPPLGTESVTAMLGEDVVVAVTASATLPPSERSEPGPSCGDSNYNRDKASTDPGQQHEALAASSTEHERHHSLERSGAAAAHSTTAEAAAETGVESQAATSVRAEAPPPTPEVHLPAATVTEGTRRDDAHAALAQRCREIYFRPRKASLHRVAKYTAQAGIAEAEADFAAIIMQQARKADDTELAGVLTRTPPWPTTDELIAELKAGMPEYAHGVCPVCGDIVALYVGSYAMPPPCGHKLLCNSCAQQLEWQTRLEPALGEVLRDALCPFCGAPDRRLS
jgi:hypothetical protein